MKRLLVTCLLLPLLAAGRDKNKPLSLSGSWMETRRMDMSRRALSYTDTIRMNFLTGNEYTWRQAGSFIFRGTYRATKDEIDMGMRQFTIVQRSGSRMVLKDVNHLYEFTRYTERPAAEDNRNATSGTRGRQEEAQYEGVRDQSLLAGKWSIYKRTSGVKPEEVNYSRIIRDIHIMGKSATAGSIGSVFAARDPATNPSWQIVRFENSTLYCSGKDNRQLKVLKCADGELIVQEGHITYFLKQF
jgi:hypothetical protein